MPEFLKSRKIFPLLWLILSLAILAFDYLTGPSIRFTILFIFPVTLAAWGNGPYWGAFIAFFLPAVHYSFLHGQEYVLSPADVMWNSAIRISSLLFFSLLVAYAAYQQRQIRVLKGLLPICSFCKRIRTPENKWEQIESYISAHSEARFSHGLCDECAKSEYGMTIKKKAS
jgi:hypothetical protein